MPARKKRPGKFGSVDHLPLNPAKLGREELALVDKLLAAERQRPYAHHYVGWPDMRFAELLKKKGLIADDGGATGCFRLTQRFRDTFPHSST